MNWLVLIARGITWRGAYVAKKITFGAITTIGETIMTIRKSIMTALANAFATAAIAGYIGVATHAKPEALKAEVEQAAIITLGGIYSIDRSFRTISEAMDKDYRSQLAKLEEQRLALEKLGNSQATGKGPDFKPQTPM